MVLLGPKLAAKAASQAAQSKRNKAEEAIVKSVQDCLHFLGALKPVMAVLSEDVAMEVCEHLLKLFVLQQPLLSRHAADCLTALASGSSNTGNLSAKNLQILIKVRPLLLYRFDHSIHASVYRLASVHFSRRIQFSLESIY